MGNVKMVIVRFIKIKMDKVLEFFAIKYQYLVWSWTEIRTESYLDIFFDQYCGHILNFFGYLYCKALQGQCYHCDTKQSVMSNKYWFKNAVIPVLQ